MLNAIQQGIFTQSTKQRLDELEQVKSDIDITNKEQRQRLIDILVNAIYSQLN